MAELQFENIFNREKGKAGFVLGLGPSLRNHLSLFKQIDHDKERYSIISCNNIDAMTSINFHYWMLAQPANEDNPFCIKNSWQRYNSHPETVFLYTDCLDLTPREWVRNHLSVDYIGYDQRHWKGEACSWGNGPGGRHSCCDGIIPGRLSIQEEFQRYTGFNDHYGCGDTVGVHMVALSVMLGLNPVYITGIDLDYAGGYVNNDFHNVKHRIAMGMNSINESPKMVARILDDLHLIKTAAEKIGTEIYDMDGGGKISKIFKHRPFVG